MHLITRCFVRTAFGMLVMACACGAWIAAQPMLPPKLAPPPLTPLYFHLLMVGWVTQLIMGVALWLFPRAGSGPRGGSTPLAWAVYAMLNFGLLARAVGEPLQTVAPGAAGAVLLLWSSVLQVLAAFGFVVAIWPRVRGGTTVSKTNSLRPESPTSGTGPG